MTKVEAPARLTDFAKGRGCSRRQCQDQVFEPEEANRGLGVGGEGACHMLSLAVTRP